MATLPSKRSGAPETPLSTFSVSISLQFDQPMDAAEVEDLSVAIQETVDRYSDQAIQGCGTSGTFSPPTVDLDVDIVAASQAGLYEHILGLMRMLEEHCSIRFVAVNQHVERVGDHEFAVA